VSLGRPVGARPAGGSFSDAVPADGRGLHQRAHRFRFKRIGQGLVARVLDVDEVELFVMPDLLVEHVAAFSDPEDPTAYVFTSAGGGPGKRAGEGGPIRSNNFRKRTLARAVRDAGLDPDLTPHDLRDTAAAIAFSNGATVKEVQRMLGHAKASITLDRYTGVLESMSARTDERLDATFRALPA
jgi:integrase